MSTKRWAAGESDSEDEEVMHEHHHHHDNDEGNRSHEVHEGGRGHEGHHHVVENAGFMMNVNFSTKLEEVKQYLEDAHCKFNHLEMIPNPKNGEFSGRVMIQFEDKESLDNFLQLNGKDFSGKQIITKVYEERGPPPSSSYRKSQGKYGKERSGDRGGRFINKIGSRDSRDERRGGGSGAQYNDYRRSSNRDDKYTERDEKYHRTRGPKPHGTEKEETPSPAAAGAGTEEAEAPKERKKVVLQPRTKPLEEIGKTDKASDIFGGGRPHDEFQYEEKKRQSQPTTTKTSEQPKEVSEELNVEKIKISEETPAAVPPAGKAEESSAVHPPKAPEEEEGAGEEDKGEKKKFTKDNKPRSKPFEKRSSRPYSKGGDHGRSHDDEDHTGGGAEGDHHPHHTGGDRFSRRGFTGGAKKERFEASHDKPYRKPRKEESGRSEDINKGDAEKPKREAGYEDFTTIERSKPKHPTQKPPATTTAAAAPATKPSSSTHPAKSSSKQSSGSSVSVAKSFAGLESDSD